LQGVGEVDSAGVRRARPLVGEERRWATGLVVDRLAGSPGWRRTVPPGCRRGLLRLQVWVAVSAGRGWTDGSAVAIMDPPGTRASWAVALVVAGAGVTAAAVVAAVGWWAPWAGAGLAAAMVAGVGARLAPTWSAGRAARRGAAGCAWLYAVAKPTGDPPGSGGRLLGGLVAMADTAGWALALETDHEPLVRRYGAFGFVEVASVATSWGRRTVMVREPAAGVRAAVEAASHGRAGGAGVDPDGPPPGAVTDASAAPRLPAGPRASGGWSPGDGTNCARRSSEASSAPDGARRWPSGGRSGRSREGRSCGRRRGTGGAGCWPRSTWADPWGQRWSGPAGLGSPPSTCS
jgi:hypothetical protein